MAHTKTDIQLILQLVMKYFTLFFIVIPSFFKHKTVNWTQQLLVHWYVYLAYLSRTLISSCEFHAGVGTTQNKIHFCKTLQNNTKEVKVFFRKLETYPFVDYMKFNLVEERTQFLWSCYNSNTNLITKNAKNKCFVQSGKWHIKGFSPTRPSWPSWS